ncbi:lipopolysaccharide heptosyltransferase I [Derxia gummosa]|uniref:Lipopolysaccharide heptosyltransferase 1 n=1 Tax=Derxia gummosa DSM 723 TaxID=1121388 RepID=A0A8B6X8L4_9BURK|nr:lipopolysaccharide heptosyltransferase I [Derxia gummosa]
MNLPAAPALPGLSAPRLARPPRRLLVVKLSALGDQIFMLAAVTDALRRWPGLEVDWVVDERFAAIPRLHPEVRRVFTVPLRRWRKAPLRGAHWRELAALVRSLRESEYDLVVDGQGMWKSLIVSRLARAADSITHDPGDCGEAGSARHFRRRCPPVPHLHGAARLRALMAAALDSDPHCPPDYALHCVALPAGIEPPPPDWALLQPHASRPHKRCADELWVRLGQALVARGVTPVLPWGNDTERAESAAICAAIGPSARLAPRLDIPAWIGWLGTARLCVSTDTGLGHIASACRVATIMLFRDGPVPVFAPADPVRSSALGGGGCWPTEAELDAALARALRPTTATADSAAAPALQRA